ncbi:putative ecotin [Leishmania braziliensis MHOM/BR/75/M2904]|uniref:Ecotin-like protein 3 n=2 Tax=Leishmania braziliensis TaxID=5660 RepID=ECOT3_LEIBR|nr:putative ecotin [Leishmania braziliensis MHOM/BR/75/M2904]A4H824.1 RecName: Full=Ecotin-like protein 3 [Leishmania braziliensis]KAI5691955.1 Ecotin [Leishmania braziliensis]CAJ2469335.1 unnamed protein product [Leishmania braziliensis]CAJ2469856.1 unnamed protein product [Leishmania braziliensis]CAM42072.1 putative ecotin [Leishmania braziliensis MHOM/BR/75/M2904]SYZ64189.1 ecotin [Leishmania braziliensis MHOM/BR/75/M2904]
MPSLEDYRIPYPAAGPCQKRTVIYLPQQDSAVEQHHLRVQLIPGRHVRCEDGCFYQLTGTVSEETLQSWGYPYYVVTLDDIYPAQCSPSDPANPRTFVPLRESPMIPYNSKRPIVVYVPEDAEVRYRVWCSDVLQVQESQQELEAPAVSQSCPVPVRERQNNPEGHAHPVVVHSVESPEVSGHKDGDQPMKKSSKLKQSCSNSSRSLKHSASGSSPKNTPLFSRESVPPEHSLSAAQQRRRSNENSAIDETGGGASRKKRSDSTSSRKDDQDSGYEKKVKNLWNRARGNSSPKRSASPKKSGRDSRRNS